MHFLLKEINFYCLYGDLKVIMAWTLLFPEEMIFKCFGFLIYGFNGYFLLCKEPDEVPYFIVCFVVVVVVVTYPYLFIHK